VRRRIFKTRRASSARSRCRIFTAPHRLPYLLLRAGAAVAIALPGCGAWCVKAMKMKGDGRNMRNEGDLKNENNERKRTGGAGVTGDMGVAAA